MVVMTKNKNNNNNPEKNYTKAGILIFTGYLTGQNYEVSTIILCIAAHCVFSGRLPLFSFVRVLL